MSQNKKGFTIVEMLIVIPIVIFVIGAFITAIVNITGEVLATRGANSLIYNIHDALDRIESDIKLSSAYLASNSITPLIAPQGLNDDAATNFSNASASGASLILNTVATTSNPLSNNRNIVYSNSPNSCGSLLSDQNTPIQINIIYFVKNNTLWRRVIMPSNYDTAGCDSIADAFAKPWQQPTCSPSASGSFCKAKDTKLVDGISATGFNINYYDSPSSTLANSIASNPANTNPERSAILPTMNTAAVTITATSTVAGRDVTQSGTVRATLIK